jgi:hypothetical protein
MENAISHLQDPRGVTLFQLDDCALRHLHWVRNFQKHPQEEESKVLELVSRATLGKEQQKVFYLFDSHGHAIQAKIDAALKCLCPFCCYPFDLQSLQLLKSVSEIVALEKPG